MPAYITRPVTVFPPHKVTTAEIIDDIRHHHPQHPKLKALPRILANVGVNTRYFTRPWTPPPSPAKPGSTTGPPQHSATP